MTVQVNSTVVAEGLGWPELDREVQVIAGSQPTHRTGLGWPPPGGRAQLGRGSDDGGPERDTLADMQTDARPAPSGGSVTSSASTQTPRVRLSACRACCRSSTISTAPATARTTAATAAAT